MNSEPLRERSPMLVSTDLARGLTLRLGFIFLGLILLILFANRLSMSNVSGVNANWPWLVVMVATAFGGIINLRLCRIPGQIQAELLQTDGDPRRWNEVRPMVGSGPIVDSWNALIEQANRQRTTTTTESNTATTALDSQNALMARAMRSVSAGVVVTDPHFQIVSANGQVAALLGMEDSENSRRSDLRGKNILTILAEIAKITPDSRNAKQNLGRLAGGGNAVTIRLQCRPKPDATNADFPTSQDTTDTPFLEEPAESQFLRISRTRLAGRDGDKDGFAWLIQDITQQIMASAARDQFLQTATHELRTPLANLRAYAEALSIESGVSVEEQKEFCNIITDETNRLSRLVDHLLTVGQLEAGSLIIQQHALEPARILEEAIEYTRPQIVAGGLTLQTDISPKLRKITGDKDKLHAVLINLIGNAAKYTPSGGSIRIVAKLRQDTVEIKVEDTGIGIAAEDLERVFEKFYRVENEHVSKQAGNGLGLAFAREVARLHHGDITVESQPGEGSVFTLHLPAPDEPRAS